jgi:hypothetical protein
LSSAENGALSLLELIFLSLSGRSTLLNQAFGMGWSCWQKHTHKGNIAATDPANALKNDQSTPERTLNEQNGQIKRKKGRFREGT